MVRAPNVGAPTWLRVYPAGDANHFEAVPDRLMVKQKATAARDFDANGFLLRHRL